MAPFFGLLLLMILAPISADDVTDGTELIFAFMIHRHGDRTPVASSLSLVSAAYDNDAVQELITPYGYGQLTNQGRQRAYRMGKFIRSRYDELLSESFNRSEIYIRSTDSTRTKMSVLTAMAAVYPAVGDTWSEEINWVPVPYTTVPALYDFNLGYLNCPVFTTGYNTMYYSAPSSFDQHSEILAKLTDLLNFNLTQSPVISYGVNDALISLKNMGCELPLEVTDLMPGLADVAALGLDVLYGQESNLAYEAGPLLNEFFEKSAAVIEGTDSQRVRIYSAHDVNVYAFKSITQIKNKLGVPNYSALYSLEVRRVTETGQYVVLPVYLPTPEEPAVYLEFDGCDNILCDYETFYNLTKQYILTESEWRTECGFSDSINMDTSGID